jgi:hypothetical protein
MLKVDEATIEELEQQYPGFRKTVEYYEALKLPPCPTCGSADTAQVSAGLVGRSTNLAAVTSKIKLLANGHPADFYCARCDRYFDAA